MESIYITTDYIQLGQFLKLAGVIDTGGMVKWFLSEHEVLVNAERENRRGKKLYPGDRIVIEGVGSFTITKKEE
ncbi:S4 domain-containing protein YaaA [Bacillaceae bacterium S4-13-58]